MICLVRFFQSEIRIPKSEITGGRQVFIFRHGLPAEESRLLAPGKNSTRLVKGTSANANLNELRKNLPFMKCPHQKWCADCAGFQTRPLGVDSKLYNHLMTLFARSSTLTGIVIPICFAALRLMTNSNFVACCTGKSAGLAPFNILST